MNKHLNKTRKNPNDEYFTYYNDIAKELINYHDQLKNKRIICPCDNSGSNFVRYLIDNKKEIDYKSLDYSTSDYTKIDYSKYDIVITNPPFSKFRDFVDLLIDKIDFLLIGNKIANNYINIFDYIKKDKIKIGYNTINNFFNLELKNKGIGTYWYTTLNIDYDKKPFIKLVKYDKTRHLKYDNYNAINCNSRNNIPNIKENIGVPVSFMIKYNPNQFELMYFPHDKFINNKKLFARIIVRIKDE